MKFVSWRLCVLAEFLSDRATGTMQALKSTRPVTATQGAAQSAIAMPD